MPNMKRLLVIYILLLLSGYGVHAQISHGGRPLPLSTMRSLDAGLFVEMPSFDVAEELRTDSLCDNDLRSGYRFAYKFMTDYNPFNSGTTFTLADGTRVWRLGIRSRGALSINILFSEYELPEGSQLFLYNADQSRVLGAFNQLNNSDLRLLPIAPVEGDELIIEYQEPANAPFRGRLTVGEVNHGYRSFKGDEPRPDRSEFSCIPPLVCYENDPQAELAGRSVVVLLIDGRISCTGALVNNTEGDGTPYLLTASHCLNGSFTIQNPDYAKVAGSIVCFFNYDSPLCNTRLRGTEEMSVASTLFRAVNEQKDMALLELVRKPPIYYQPYYAGWNAKDAGTAPYSGIHHPAGTIKRISIYEKTPRLVTFSPIYFDEKSHWNIDRWNVGITAGGSSGSPLFDADYHIIGALSGGNNNMSCKDPTDDNYFALSKAWSPSSKPDKQLKHWLDPAGKGQLLCAGFDPYAPNLCYRLSNVKSSKKQETVEAASLASPQSGPLFGNNSLSIAEYAEEYNVGGQAKIYGAYFVTPSVAGKYTDLKVEVTVYTGSTGPETLLYTELFQPTYINTDNKGFVENIKPLDRAQESYINFATPVEVSGRFYIGYRITASGSAPRFSVFSLPKGETARNTAWVNQQGKWTEATAYPAALFSTSLFIDPVVEYQSSTSNQQTELFNPVRIFYDATGKTASVWLPEGVEEAGFKLYLINGQAVQEQRLSEKQTKISLSPSASGACLIEVTYENKRQIQKVLL